MNYRLSVCSVRTEGKNGYVLEAQGKLLDSKVGSLKSTNIKKDVLTILVDALRCARSYVKHEDIMYIEIQNMHLQQWLSGMVEYKDYATELDAVFEVLESIDCRYKFVFLKEPYARSFVKTHNLEGIKAGSFSDVMKDFG